MAEHEPIDLTDLPAAYQRWRASDLGRITDRIEEELILDLAGPAADRDVLDVGCGDGVLSMRLARAGARVTGLDTSARSLEMARARARVAKFNTTFVEGNVEALPFPDSSFDVLTAVTVLCFVPEREKAFGEMTRVLRPGGRLVIGELGRYSLWAVRRRIDGWRGSRTWRAARFSIPPELTRLAERSGLEIGSVRNAIYYPPCNRCARWLSPFDQRISRLTSFGAAFIALSATKPL